MKGILFSVGLILMGLIILGATFVIAQARLNENVDVLKLAVFDRMYDETRSIGNGYKTIVLSAIDVNIIDNSITFTESIPNPNAGRFKDDAVKFKQFAESFAEFSLNVTPKEGTLPLLILPSFIKYDHPNGFGGNAISITNASSVKKYDLDLFVKLAGDINFNWNPKRDDPAGLEVHIHADTFNNSFDQTVFLDRGVVSIFEVKSAGKKVTLTFNELPGSLNIVDNDNVGADVTNMITVDTKEPLFLALNEESINIAVAEYNITSKGPVRVL